MRLRVREQSGQRFSDKTHSTVSSVCECVIKSIEFVNASSEWSNQTDLSVVVFVIIRIDASLVGPHFIRIGGEREKQRENAPRMHINLLFSLNSKWFKFTAIEIERHRHKFHECFWRMANLRRHLFIHSIRFGIRLTYSKCKSVSSVGRWLINARHKRFR